MRLNKRASLEIGVNTIVILVIAMVLLGLGVGFIKSLFNPINKLPGVIEIPKIGKEPSAAEPVVIGQSEITIKAGSNVEQVTVGVYNAKWDAATYAAFAIGIPSCTDGVLPKTVSLAQVISKGESKGFLVNVGGDDAASGSLPTGTYICNVAVYGGPLDSVARTATTPGSTPLASTQFTLKITT